VATILIIIFENKLTKLANLVEFCLVWVIGGGGLGPLGRPPWLRHCIRSNLGLLMCMSICPFVVCHLSYVTHVMWLNGMAYQKNLSFFSFRLWIQGSATRALRLHSGSALSPYSPRIPISRAASFLCCTWFIFILCLYRIRLTQSFFSRRCTCPNHLSLASCTLSVIQAIRMRRMSSFLFLSIEVKSKIQKIRTGKYIELPDGYRATLHVIPNPTPTEYNFLFSPNGGADCVHPYSTCIVNCGQTASVNDMITDIETSQWWYRQKGIDSMPYLAVPSPTFYRHLFSQNKSLDLQTL